MAPLSDLRNRIAPAERERGAVLVLTALVMMLLLFIAAFATDLGAWYRQGQEQQRAADVGALNGVQAYDTAVKTYWEELNNAIPAPSTEINRWSDLSAAQMQEAEERGLRAAAQTIIGVLESTGLTFTDVGSGVLASDPTDVFQTSIWTIVADDGTQIIITRSFQETGLDSSNNPTYSRAIDVQVVAGGEQYFSNIIRDAPQISKTGQSVLSNCGAACERSVVIPPPFAGFNAASQGDGFAPLLYNKDGNTFNGYEEIWSVNHHAFVGRSPGDIVCMVAKTQEPCLGFTDATETDGVHFPIDTLYPTLETANFPQDYMDEDTGIILFGGRDAANKTTGIACFDAAARTTCDTPYVPLFAATYDYPGSGGFEAMINLYGVHRNGNEYFAFGQDGTWGCVELAADTSMTDCGTGNTPAAGTDMPNINATRRYVNHAEQVGSELYVVQATTTSGQYKFYCFDMDTQNACWTTPVRLIDTGVTSGAQSITFLGYDSSGQPDRICVVRTNGGVINSCRYLSNGAEANLPTTFNNNFAGISHNWSGDDIFWSGEANGQTAYRTFFSGGRDNTVFCWDWRTSSGCGSITTNRDIHGIATKPNGIYPYDFAQVSRECIIGLSDKSVFFTFNPVDFTACVDTQVRAKINPCQCEDESETRWGTIQMPTELMNLASTLEATITATENGAAIAGLDGVDVLATGGVLDLSAIQDSHIVEYENIDGVTLPIVYLTLTIDVYPSATFPPDGIVADLQIVVQPTLSN